MSEIPEKSEERRTAQRVECVILVEYRIGNARLGNCIIKNISSTGARLMFLEGIWRPTHFYLRDIEGKLICAVHKKWEKGNEIGVEFLDWKI